MNTMKALCFDKYGPPSVLALTDRSHRRLRESRTRGGRQIAITNVGKRRVEFDLIEFYHEESSKHVLLPQQI